MTNEEFSNAFDTLINAYKHRSEFGDQGSLADISADEYEKSLFLTQAQDTIVKAYFERALNPQGAGFDDSIRRQMDFSNLITVKRFPITGTRGSGFSDNGYLMSFKDSDFVEGNVKAYPLFIINEKVSTGSTFDSYTAFTEEEVAEVSSSSNFWLKTDSGYIEYGGTAGAVIEDDLIDAIKGSTVTAYHKSETTAVSDSLVVVPINYRDYDRMMSKAYCEPLKRQAWRLFESSSTDLGRQVEIIVRTDAGTPVSYKVRYVRRPRPIILVDLSGTDNNLSIDDIQEATECELNPIIHQDILNEAVRLALATNGIETQDMKAARQAAQNNR